MGKTLALVFGWVFLLVGILGFFPNPIVGPDALFQTDLNHNLVHLISGLVFLGVAYLAPLKSALTLKVFGVVYLLVAVLGLVLAMDGGTLLGLIEINSADNWLHVVLGLVALIGGIKADRNPGMTQSM